MRTDAGQIDEAVDRAQQVVGRDMPLKAELVASCATVRSPIIAPPSAQGRLNQNLKLAATLTSSTQSAHSGHPSNIEGNRQTVANVGYQTAQTRKKPSEISARPRCWRPEMPHSVLQRVPILLAKRGQ